MRTVILTSSVGPDKYVAWVDGSPLLFAYSYESGEAAIGLLILSGQVPCCVAVKDVFEEKESK